MSIHDGKWAPTCICGKCNPTAAQGSVLEIMRQHLVDIKQTINDAQIIILGTTAMSVLPASTKPEARGPAQAALQLGAIVDLAINGVGHGGTVANIRAQALQIIDNLNHQISPDKGN